ncbi:SIR2 family protein [Pedobacter chitinilyticus]|uniref:Uncharacterized protein n=1 Tax=Pedobacter chitinilyticus TaxID=2233776 RepID=A0A443YVZ1_9SPHI|nr:SIR2 family protein [Pedobacter chitinilyticus]RWU08170.1 hypothetical protein DPV69_07250 [Pedobacter chitinilyticus]
MSSNTPYVHHLEKLQKNLSGQDLSILVGAGFSKNVDPAFPSWGQLLYRMVDKIKGKQFEEDFKKTKLPASKKKAYLENRYNEFIDEVGYLKVPSLYRDRMGYREALEHYIEQVTPFVDKEHNLCYDLDGVPKKRVLTDKDLELHKKLVRLPWNNIFTTNYDNLLESCTDQDLERSLTEQKKMTREIMDALEKELEELGQKKKDIDDLITDLEKKVEGYKIRNLSYVLSDAEKEEWDQHERSLAEQRAPQGQVNGELYWKKSELDRHKELLNKVEEQLRDCANLVRHSAELALKRNGNIIKLHGSLRLSPEDKFGFDTDPRKHYVICQEDYDTYPTKHEAFTQLMRISLLREAFCLVGFSGTDPNFLAWIGWVRDIIFKKPLEHDDKGGMKKIYLIGTSNKPADAATAIFHENHQIAFIPILHPDCVAFLKREVGGDIDPSADFDTMSKAQKALHIKAVFSLFFDYLRKTASQARAVAAVELYKRSQYENLCKELPIRSMDRKIPNEKSFSRRLIDIGELAEFNRLPSPHFNYDAVRADFLQNYVRYVRDRKTKIPSAELFGILQLIRSQYYPHSSIFDKTTNEFAFLMGMGEKAGRDAHFGFLLEDLRDSIWKLENDRAVSIIKVLEVAKNGKIQQELSYLVALKDAINLNFSSMNRSLAIWRANGHWLINKAGLLSLIDQQRARGVLKEETQRNLQEHLYKLELLSGLRERYGDDRAQLEERRQLKAKGLHELNQHVTLLIDQLKRARKKIVPYGSGKASFNRSITLTNNSDHGLSFQVLGLLMQSGFPAVGNYTAWLSSDDFYLVASRSFSYYPFPTLFYALQYSDEKMLKRLAQDYIYNEHITNEELERIASSTTHAYSDKHVPRKYLKSIPIFLSELVLAVSPSLWEPFFKQYWKDAEKNGKLFVPRFDRSDDFLEKALRYVQAPKILAIVVDTCLNAIEKSEVPSDLVSDYLYALANNHALKHKSAEIRKLLVKGFFPIIDRLNEQPNLIFALGNMSELLTEGENLAISNVVMDMDYSKVSNPRSWRIFLHFIGTDELIQKIPDGAFKRERALQQIKDAILKSSDLWNAGFRPDSTGVSGNSEFISLTALREENHTVTGLQWSPAEIAVIYQKLRETTAKINEWMQVRQGASMIENLFAFILEEMRDFLRDEKQVLHTLPGYDETVDLIDRHHIQQRSYNDLLEGLTSREHNNVLGAVNELMSLLYYRNERTAYEMHIIALLNKLLLQSEPCLESCLKYIAYFFYNKFNEKYLRRFTPYLLEIIKRYRVTMPAEVELPFVYEHLIMISFVLERWGETDENINYFLSMKQESKFNNIRYGLSQKFLNDGRDRDDFH